MPALVIILAFFGVNIALSAFGFIILYMPYAVGFLVSLILCNTNPAIQALIPGHPWMSFVSVLALTEALIAILTHIKQISCSFIIFSCSPAPSHPPWPYSRRAASSGIPYSLLIRHPTERLLPRNTNNESRRHCRAPAARRTVYRYTES